MRALARSPLAAGPSKILCFFVLLRYHMFWLACVGRAADLILAGCRPARETRRGPESVARARACPATRASGRKQKDEGLRRELVKGAGKGGGVNRGTKGVVKKVLHTLHTLHTFF